MVLTLFAFGGGGAQCALTTVIALKTRKNEKNFFLKVQIKLTLRKSYGSKFFSKRFKTIYGLLYFELKTTYFFRVDP